jgi:DNA-binding CsgD family transcriptional regulator
VRPTTGWASLTPTERTVAELAASGLTNPQIARSLFVSRHTVHTHVAHVLAKLQLSSRVELAAEVAIRRAKGVREDPKQLQPADEGHRRSALDGHPT